MKKIIFAFLVLGIIILSGCVDGTTDNVPTDNDSKDNGTIVDFDLCAQRFETEGLCKMLITGYEYDYDSDLCVELKEGGCSGTSPFNSREDCQVACEKEYNSESWKEIIPGSCKSFSDGCNRCSREDAESATACTEMACQEYKRPRCLD